MTFADTLQYLSTLPAAVQIECLTAALLEPDEHLQRGAVRMLASPDLKRLDVVVDHYPTLLPVVQRELAAQKQDLLAIAREKIVSGRDARRLGAFVLVDAFGDLGAAELLAVGVSDPVAEVSTVAIEGVVARLSSYALARRTAQIFGEPLPNGRDAQQESAWQALGTTLRRCPANRCEAVCGVLFDLGPVALSLFRPILLTQPDDGMAKAFVQALGHGPGGPSAAFVIALATDLDSRVQRIGQQVLRDRRDVPFAIAVAREVAGLREERALQQARSPRELPWWGPVQHVTGELEPQVAKRLLAMIADLKANPEKRQEMVEPFLLHKEPSVQLAALQELHELKCTGGFEGLAKMLASNATGAGMRAAAQLVLDLAPTNRAALLAPLLGSPDAELRRMATREVSKVSFQRYLERFDQMDPAMRATAAKALAKIDATMLDRVAEEIGAFDPARRLKALHIVEALDAGAELRQPLLELLDDPDRRVRATAVRIVELAGSREGIQILVGTLSDPDRRVRANAIEAFEELADPRYTQMLVPYLKDSDNRVRGNTVKALWNLRWPGAREALLGMLSDPEELVRMSAVWVLGEIEISDRRALLQAREAQDPSPKVRAKIRELLATLPAKEVRA